MLSDSVYRVIEVLNQVKWFENCGKPLDLEPSMIGKIEQCLSWEEAIQESEKYEWKCIKNEAINQISEYLDTHHRKVYQNWNIVIGEIQPILDAVYEKKIMINLTGKSNNEAGKSIRRDVLRLLLETHWSYLVEPVFFTPVTFWYIKGHFPCGWRGNFPDGKLLVF
jgi:hypothetical protein